jgi:2-oxoglutarate ferredoxin oxidoreductase subunit delta
MLLSPVDNAPPPLLNGASPAEGKRMPESIAEKEISPSAGSKKSVKKGPRGRITIYGTWCKGCGLCAAFCPTGVLVLDQGGHPVVAAPEKCSACHWCDTHCPDLAIVVTRILD